MITPIVKETKVVFGPCRLSYAHLMQKHSFDNNESNAKYSVTVLIPKTEKQTVEALRRAIGLADQEGKGNKDYLRKSEKGDLHMPLLDGDKADFDESGTMEGHWYLNAKCNTRPGVVDTKKNPIMDEEEVYSGMWGIVSVTFYPFTNRSYGVACGLNNVMKTADGERLGGRVSASRDFADVQWEDESDDL